MLHDLLLLADQVAGHVRLAFLVRDFRQSREVDFEIYIFDELLELALVAVCFDVRVRNPLVQGKLLRKDRELLLELVDNFLFVLDGCVTQKCRAPLLVNAGQEFFLVQLLNKHDRVLVVPVLQKQLHHLLGLESL